MASVNQPKVLIVGGGPSGLMMAHELARFEVPFMIIEKDLVESPYSRALAVQIRTLEIFHALSLFDALNKSAEPVGAIEIFTDGKGPIRIDLPKTTSFFPRLLVVDQPHTEKVLENALHKLGAVVHRGVELLSLRREEDGNHCELKNQHGQIEHKKFAFVVGADGAHSAVRKSMSNLFKGHAYEDAFILADAECHHPYSHDVFRIFFKKRHFFATIPMHGSNHYRLISVREGESKKIGAAPAIEEFQKLAKEVVPYTFDIVSKTWVSRFFVQCRSAAHYQEDGIFLVGDAAHIHSPAGGQGMNTGLQDAFNLAWKLAMTIKGLTHPEILETYHEERKPVGDFLIDRTDRLFKFMVRSSLWARLLRWFILPRVARSEKAKRAIATIGSQIGIRYETGVVCENVEHLKMPGLKVGERVVNLNLMSNHLSKTDLHSLVSALHVSWLFFLPKNTNRKKVAHAIGVMERITRQWPKSARAFLIFGSDYDAEKSVLDADYYVSINPSASFIFDEPSYIVVRPDHHIFCIGLLTEIDHAASSLKKFLINSEKA